MSQASPRQRTRWSPRRPRAARRFCGTPPASRTCRTSRTFSARSARRSRGSARTPSRSTVATSIGGGTHRIGPDHIEVGSFIGLAAVTKSEIRIEAAGVEHLRSTLMGFARLGIACRIEGDDLIVPAEQSPRDPVRPWWSCSEAGGSAVAGVSGGRDVHRDRHRHTVQRTDTDPRENVRVADVLRGQADRHGGAHRPVRSAPRVGGRPVAAPRGDGGIPRHSCRHGHAARRHVRRKARARSTTRVRSSAVTSASTSDSTRSAPGSREWTTAAGDRGCASDAGRMRRRTKWCRSSTHSASTPSRRRGQRGASASRARNRCAKSWRRWDRLRADLAPAGPRLATARQVHGERVLLHGTGWEGWLRGGDADGHLAMDRGTGDGGVDRGLRPVFHRPSVRRDRSAAFRMAGHGGTDRRARDRR